MYTRQEISLIKQKFWTRFGQYMRPIKGAEGETVNWLNYKTGIRHLYFRLDAARDNSSIGIELQHTDTGQQAAYFEQLQQLKNILEGETGEAWHWQLLQRNEDGKIVSRITKTLAGVNIFNEDDWPAIISFLKPRIIALDAFWMMVKDGFE